MNTSAYNYILFSDVHLGADLVQHVRPWTADRLSSVARIDQDLGEMLDYYRKNRDPDRPWCLVIAGDLVDFIGMSIAPVDDDEHVDLELSEEEKRHGLGSASRHASIKMKAVARRHRYVFQKLAAFVAEGHGLVLVRGNHDLDFHWESARDAFVDALVDHRDALAGELRRESEESFRGRVEFYPWFYYVEGLLYVEHGHQFDAMCQYPHLLAPLSPANPTRLQWSFSDLLLRLVSRPTPGLGCENHNEKKIVDYLRLGASLGVVGALRLAHRFYRAISEAVSISRALISQPAQRIREEHRRRMAEVAKRMKVRLDQLEEVASMWPAPVTRGLFAVIRSVFVDRIALTALLSLVLVVLAVTGVPWFYWMASLFTSVLAYVGYSLWSGRIRHREVQPVAEMARAAGRISKLFRTPLVVMGHTHEPGVEQVGPDSTYVNLGYWGVDDLDGDESHEPPRTHLVLRWVDGRPIGEFCRWVRDRGPEALEQISNLVPGLRDPDAEAARSEHDTTPWAEQLPAE